MQRFTQWFEKQAAEALNKLELYKPSKGALGYMPLHPMWVEPEGYPVWCFAFLLLMGLIQRLSSRFGDGSHDYFVRATFTDRTEQGLKALDYFDLRKSGKALLEKHYPDKLKSAGTVTESSVEPPEPKTTDKIPVEEQDQQDFSPGVGTAHLVRKDHDEGAGPKV